MAVRLSRIERKAQTREQILAAALEVFLRDGFHGATLDDIADEAGYTKGAVYSNFSGKDDLFLALLDAHTSQRLAAYREAAARARTVQSALRANARIMAETAKQNPLWAPLLVEFWVHASREPELRAAAAEHHERVLDAVGEVLEEISRRFGVEWAGEPREIVRGASAFSRGMALERVLDPGVVDVDRFEDEFLLFVEAHLRPAQEGA